MVNRQLNRLGAAQCGLAAVVFGMLFLSQLFAYLLYLNPQCEWLWAWALTVGPFTTPILDIYDLFAPGNPILSSSILASLSCLPLLACVRRNWLGTSISGHVALGICIIGLSTAIDRGWYSEDLASRLVAFDPAMFDSREWVVAFTAAALTIFCGANHVRFFQHMAKS
jgi:hypothetical protein